jgi:hypothetical protein
MGSFIRKIVLYQNCGTRKGIVAVVEGGTRSPPHATDLRLVNRDRLRNPADPLSFKKDEDARTISASRRSHFAIAWAVARAFSDTGVYT